MGSETDVVKISGAQLFLIDRGESVLMQKGDFSLRLVKQEHSPLAAIVAAVGEVQWPIGKDAPALKVWNRHYTFALPGLMVYGLLFPAETPVEVLQQLEAVMNHYCTFEVHQEIAAAARHQISGSDGRSNMADYWTAMAPDVESTSLKIAQQICSKSSIAVAADHGSITTTHSIRASAEVVGRGVPRMLKRMQQARRMSAIAKIMSMSVLKGAIDASQHVASCSVGLDVNATDISNMSDHFSSGDVAVASVDAFAKLVEAVETAGNSVYGMTSAATAVGGGSGNNAAVVGNVINTSTWTLNQMGLIMLLQVIAASTALNTHKRTSTRSFTSREEEESPSSPRAASMSPASTTSEDSRLLPENYGQQTPPMRTQTFFGPSAVPAAAALESSGAPIMDSRFTPTGNHTSSLNPRILRRPNSRFRHYMGYSQP
ncbi:unnamed protein product [Sphagnum jensenii]|uniref:Senescence domain-containing protein n=1 Tax=Sphagnum jensenii TaxID=128206 RepID=A0ABP1A668_9BRYO